MSYTLKHVSGPATEPVTLAELKLALNLDPTETAQDQYLEGIIGAARREAENYLGKKIGIQTWDIYLDDFPLVYDWQIPIEPLISVDSINYTDEDGLETAIDTGAYRYSVIRRALWLVSGEAWPNAALIPFGAVRVRVTCGIVAVSDGASPESFRFPESIRQAIIFRAGTFYRFREDMTAGTTLQVGKVGTFEALLSGERVIAP